MIKLKIGRKLTLSIQIIVLLFSILAFCIVEKEIKIYSTLSLLATCLFIYILYKYYGNFFIPEILLYISFCIFHLGQYYLKVFNIDYDYFFENTFYMSYIGNINIVYEAIFYSTICCLMFGIGLVYSGKKKNRIIEKSMHDKNILKITGKFLFIISFIPMAVYTIVQIYLVVIGGYANLRSSYGESLLSSIKIFSRISTFYIPSLIILKLNYINTKWNKLINVLFIIHFLCYSLIGQRTISVATLLVLLLIDRNNGKKIRVISLLVLLFFIAISSSIIGQTRTGTEIEETSSIFDYASSFIGECGWSSYTLCVVISLCQKEVNYMYGIEYLASTIGLIPSFIDPTGTIDRISSIATEEWLTQYLGFNFGVGYSLATESYFNFSKYGIFAILIISILIGNITNKDIKEGGLTFNNYCYYVLTYELLTLPRRSMYIFFNAILYDILVIIVVNSLFSKIKESQSAIFIK